MANETFYSIWKMKKEIEFDIQSEISTDLVCNICNKLMTNACQSNCGCRYCLECIESYLQNTSKFCPGKSKYCQVKLINFERDIIVDNAINIRISEVVVKCPRKNCEFKDEFGAIASHMRTCDKNPIICPYYEFGCNKTEVLNNEINDHLNSESYCHNKLLIDFINNLRNEIESMKNEMVELQMENRSSYELKVKMSELAKNDNKNKSIIENLNQRLIVLTNENLSLKFEIEKNTQAITDIREIIGETKYNFQNPTNQIKIEEIDNFYNTINSEDIDDDTKSEEIIFGVLEWKIDKLFHQESNIWKYSREFFTHKFGYKMCLSLKICYNVINVYFHLMRGEYDDKLTWPFKYNVTVDAINQNDGHIYSTNTIKYDFCPQHNAWIKPTTERNSEIWFFTFLEGTLKCDKLTLKCTVNSY